MQPSTQLPAQYKLRGEIDLSKNKGLALLLNLGAVVLFFVFGALFTSLALALRPDLGSLGGEISGLRQTLNAIALLVGLIVFTVVLHELIHGLFFWLFTKSRPRYGFKGLYAYAAAPDWYLPRNQYLVVGMAPLVGITLVGLLLAPVIPAEMVLPLLFVLTINAAGAIGDLAVVGWLLFQPATVLLRDTGDGITLYRPDR